MAFNAASFTVGNLAQATANELATILCANTDAEKAAALNGLRQQIKIVLGQGNADPDIDGNAARALLADAALQAALGTAYAARGAALVPANAAGAGLTDALFANLLGANNGAAFKAALAAHADVGAMLGLTAAQVAQLSDDAAEAMMVIPAVQTALGAAYAARGAALVPANAAGAGVTEEILANLLGANNGAAFKAALAAHADVGAMLGLTAAQVAQLSDDAAEAMRVIPAVQTALGAAYAARGA